MEGEKGEIEQDTEPVMIFEEIGRKRIRHEEITIDFLGPFINNWDININIIYKHICIYIDIYTYMICLFV